MYIMEHFRDDLLSLHVFKYCYESRDALFLLARDSA